jgi:NADPH:quinone reductase-like Zn-dependent oxidoreductase
MRAAVRTGLLGLTISFKEDVPVPVQLDPNVAIGPTDMLIKVKSAAINPVDYKLPRVVAGSVVGLDVSGVVERVGPGVTDFRAGDAVFGRAASGSLAEYALVSANEVAIKPEWLPHDGAAALGVAYLTGLQSMRAGKVGGGSSVLVIGASGGCGIAGVQLANAMGASRIVGICSGKNFEFVRGTSGIEGVEGLELIDYTDDDALKRFREKNVGKFDCIYDTATGSGKGEDYVPSMIPLLKEKTGEYVQINGPPSTWARHVMGKMKPQRTMILTSGKSKPHLEEIVSLLKKSNTKPHLDVKSFDENGVKGGFEQLKGRRTMGKIVFNMD